MARLLEEKPLRKALAEVLGMKDKMRVEVAAKRYRWKSPLRGIRSLCRGGVQAPHLSWQQTSGRNGLNPEVRPHRSNMQQRGTDELWRGFSYQVGDRFTDRSG